jgi:hypothetical protein
MLIDADKPPGSQVLTGHEAADDRPSGMQRPPVPLEGIVYGEIAAWITVIGMAVAALGLVAGFIHGGGILNETGVLSDLFGGRGEGAIWLRDSVFSSMPEHYWFLKERLNGDELAMIGLVLACYGGVVGTWGMFLSMFRKKEVLFHTGGLYAVLAGIVGLILTLAASGIISLS